MLPFSFDMAAPDGCRIDKRYTRALSQSSHFEGNSKKNTDFSFQLYKSIVGNSMGEIRLHMCLDKEMEMLQISKRGEVEKDESRHHLAIG